MYKKTWRNLVKSEGNPIVGKRPHFIFSAEQPRYDQRIKMDHDQTVQFLRDKGYKVNEMSGRYGGVDERSIIIHDVKPESLQGLHELARDLGQESSISSDGYNHSMVYHGGENAGMHVRGQGSNIHKKPPEDFYSTLPDGTTFTHNFNFDQWHRNEKDDVNKSERKPEVSHDEIAQEYANLDTEAPQIILKPDKKGYATIDGVHRSRAAALKGRQEIEAYVLGKSENNNKYLDHYSVHQNLSEIDPQFHGTGKDLTQKQSKNRSSKFSFYYPGNYDNPEADVVNASKSKYQVKLEPHHKIFDVEEHGRDIIQQSKLPSGHLDMNAFVDNLKQAGFHGFVSHPHEQNPHKMIAMFDKMPVHSESPIKPFSFKKSESDIKKMSRPMITFPKLGLDTRPDQQVQTIETPRQKKMYGRVVANAKIPDETYRIENHKQDSDGTMHFQNEEQVRESRQPVRDKESKRISGKFSRDALGLMAPTKQGPKSAALAGKERSKFESYDDTHSERLEEWKEKRKSVADVHNKKMKEWYDEAYPLFHKPDRSPEEDAHLQRLIASKPQKPRMPRKPSKKKIDTAQLNLEQITERGRTIDSTIAHEGLHHTLEQLRSKYGYKTHKKITNQLLGSYDEGALKTLAQFVENRGYKRKNPSFGEELLTHARDILVNPVKRKAFKKQFGEDVANPVIQKLKQGHQRAYELAQQIDEDALGKSELKKDEGNPSLFGKTPAPKPASPSHSEKIRNLAAQYAKGQGFEYQPMQRKYNVNEDRAKKIAAAYHDMPHNPNDPQVKEAYDALINETMNQWKAIQQSGLRVTPIQPGQENPYKSSKDVHKDIRENNHLYYFPTDQGFGSKEEGGINHPMLRQTDIEIGGKPAVANDIFRIVHDYFGHGKEGTGFGPKGEENAWHAHRRMYSPIAQRALTTETRGQNSWVNFGPHGEANRANPANTIYADQKAGLLPDWAMEYDEDEPVKKSENDLQKMGMRGDWKKEGYEIKESFEDSPVFTGPRISAFKDGQEVGFMRLNNPKSSTMESFDLEVDKPHRRKGLATAMYSHAEKKYNKKFKPAKLQTKYGKTLWNQPNRPFGKSEIEKNMKGLRAGILGAVAAGNIASANPPSQDFMQQDTSKQVTIEKPSYQTIPNQKINYDQQPQENNKNHILNAISMVESSGGKNTNHEKLPANSIHQNERAYGKYGLTPLLVRETIEMHKDLSRKYGDLTQLKGDEFHEKMKQYPELEDTIASRHYDRLARKFGHDPVKIGYSWLSGITGTMRAVEQNKNLNNHWHVKKIMNAYKKSKTGQ